MKMDSGVIYGAWPFNFSETELFNKLNITKEV